MRSEHITYMFQHVYVPHQFLPKCHLVEKLKRHSIVDCNKRFLMQTVAGQLSDCPTDYTDCYSFFPIPCSCFLKTDIKLSMINIPFNGCCVIFIYFTITILFNGCYITFPDKDIKHIPLANGTRGITQEIFFHADQCRVRLCEDSHIGYTSSDIRRFASRK